MSDNKTQNLIFIFIMALMIILVICPGSYADSEVPVISLSSATAGTGDTVKLTVSIANNPGILNAQFCITYNQDALQLVKVSDGGILGTFNFSDTSENLAKIPYTLTWVNKGENPDFNYTQSGILAILTFKIMPDAEDITYDIGLGGCKLNNNKLEDITCRGASGHITVKYVQKIYWAVSENKLSLSTNIKCDEAAIIYASFYDVNGKMLGLVPSAITGQGVQMVSFDDLHLDGVSSDNYQKQIKTVKFFTLNNFIPLAEASAF